VTHVGVEWQANVVHYIRHLALITPYAHFELHFKTSREKYAAVTANQS